MTKFKITRDITKTECPWLDNDITKGTIVFGYVPPVNVHSCEDGIVCTFEYNVLPFFEIPISATEEYSTDVDDNIFEKDLLALGFNKIHVPIEESGDDTYDYFTYEISDNFVLISNSSDDAENGYYIEIFDTPGKSISNLSNLKTVLNALNLFNINSDGKNK